MNETPILRVLMGPDPMASATGQVDVPSYAHVQLRWDAQRAGFASDQAGRPVFDKVLVLRHVYPGTPDYLDVQVKRYPPEGGEPQVLDPVRWSRFREVLERFERDGEAAAGGTPLAVMNLDPAAIATLQASGVQSAEMLADVPDSVLERLGQGGRAMRDRARAYFAALEGNAPMAKLEADNDRLREDLAELKQQLAEYHREMAAAHDSKPALATGAKKGHG